MIVLPRLPHLKGNIYKRMKALNSTAAKIRTRAKTQPIEAALQRLIYWQQIGDTPVFIRPPRSDHPPRTMRMLVQPGLDRTPSVTLASTGDPNAFVYLDLANQAAGIGSYANPLTGTSDFGPFPSNMDARNSFRLPGMWNADAIFSKRFSLAGARGLQVRVETYNLFNHAIFNVPGSTFGNADFRVVSSARPGRTVQLAARLSF